MDMSEQKEVTAITVKRPKKETAVATKTSAEIIGSGEELIARAIDAGAAVETIERLMAMREKLRAEKAKKEFDQAMANFQAECPIIIKSKSVRSNDGKELYKYAPLDVIVNKVKKPIADNGLSYFFQVVNEDKIQKVICFAKHIGGHQEPSEMKITLGTKTAIMSSTQHEMAAITYAKRQSFCNAFGILTGDPDTDGADLSKARPVEAKQEKPRAESLTPYQQAIKVIADSNSVAALTMLKGRIQSGRQMADLEKDSLCEMITLRIKKLNDEAHAAVGQ